MKTKRTSEPAPEPANTNADSAPKTKANANAAGGRGQPVEVNTHRSYGDPEQALPIDSGPGYKPGDVFANDYAGLPGFEGVNPPGDTKAVASAGLQGPSQPLPHADAYAHATPVGFKDQPDLHTAAHEAAHVVQATGQVKFNGKPARPPTRTKNKPTPPHVAVSACKRAATLRATGPAEHRPASRCAGAGLERI